MFFQKNYSRILGVVLCVGTIGAPASAQSVLAWWSQIIGSHSAPVSNGTLTA
jgi:hypothetical protein